MRASVRAACVAVALAGGPAGAGVEPAKNLLFFGNSFTGSGGGVHLLVRDLAVAAGHAEPYVFALVVGGTSLEWHLAYATPLIDREAPAGGSWDHVVLQELSTRPTDHPTLGDPTAFYDAALGMTRAVRAHSPDAGAVLFETWARGPGHAFYPGDWAGPGEMQSQLTHHYGLGRDGIDGALGAGVARVAPVGSAFGLGGFDRALYADDLWHASGHGALLAGLVLYATIYDDPTLGDLDLSPIAARLGVGAGEAAALARLAERAVPAPGGAGVLVLGVVWARRRRGR